MIDWGFNQWYNVEQRPLNPIDCTEQWKKVQKEYKEEICQRNLRLLLESMAEMTKQAGESLWERSRILLLQVLQKVKFLITRSRWRS